MKKKRILTAFVFLAVVLLGVWLFFRAKTLGSMAHSYAEPATSSSSFTFAGEAGSTIRISFASNIESGNLNVVLYDPMGNAVYDLDQARKLKTFFTLNSAGPYTLTAEYSDFVGNFDVTVYSAD